MIEFSLASGKSPVLGSACFMPVCLSILSMPNFIYRKMSAFIRIYPRLYRCKFQRLHELLTKEGQEKFIFTDIINTEIMRHVRPGFVHSVEGVT